MPDHKDVLINIIVNGRNNAKGVFSDVQDQLEGLSKELKNTNKETEKLTAEQKKVNQAYGEYGRIAKKSSDGLSRFNDLLKQGLKITQDQKAAYDKVQSSLAAIQTLANANTKSVKENNSEIAKQNRLRQDGAKILEQEAASIAKVNESLAKGDPHYVRNIKNWKNLRNELERAGISQEEFIKNQEKIILSNHGIIDVGKSFRAITKDIREANEMMKELEETWTNTLKSQGAANRQALIDGGKEVAKSKRIKESYDEIREAARQRGIEKRKEIDLAKEAIRVERESVRANAATLNRDPIGRLNATGTGGGRPHVTSRGGMLGGAREITEQTHAMRDFRDETAGANKELSLFARAINKVSGGRVSIEDKNDQFKNLRGLTSELRGFGIAFAIKNVQGLASAGVGAAGGLTSLAASAISAGSALGGALAAGAAQAIGPLSVLMSTIGRITAITKVVNLQQQIKEASTHTAQTDAAGKASDSLASAQERVADATRGATQAQNDYNESVRQAKRDLQDMRLEQMRANLSVEDAKRALSSAMLGNDTAAIAEARLGLREAQLKAGRAGSDNRRAQRAGVQGQPNVVAARERVADANRQAAQATRALAEAENGLAAAGDGATASQDRLNYMLSQLSPAERRLVKSVGNIQDAYKKSFRGVSDIIIGEISNSVDIVAKLFKRNDLIKPFIDNAKAGAASIKAITSFLTSEGSLSFVKTFTELSTANIPKITEGLINLGEAFMNVASNSAGVFNTMLDDLVKLTKNIKDATSNSQEFFDNSLKDYEAWKGLLESIWDLFKVIFNPARQSGMEMIVWFTKQINSFVTNLKANPEALKKFFDDGAYSSQQILRVIWEIGKALYEVFKPESVKALADFLITIIIPAFKQAIITIGAFTNVIQEFLALPVVSGLARWILTVTLLTRAFEIMHTAIKNIGLAVANFASLLVGGGGMAARMRLLVGVIILVSSSLGILGVNLNDLNKFLHDNKTAVEIAATALGTFLGLMAVSRIAAYIEAVGGLTAAFKALAASEAVAGSMSFFGKTGGSKGGFIPWGSAARNTTRSGGVGTMMGKFKGASKLAKGGTVAGLAAGIAAPIIGSQVGGTAGSAIGNIGGGAALGATVGSVIPGVGTAVGAGVGALAGGLVTLAGAYSKTKKAQEEVARSTKNSTDALLDQLDAIRAVKDAQLDNQDAKLGLKQARLDVRSAKRNVTATYNQLKNEGLTDAEIKRDDRYKQALLDRSRAYLQLKRAAQAADDAQKNIGKTNKASADRIKKDNDKIVESTHNLSKRLSDAQKDFDDAKSNAASMLKTYGKNSLEYKAALAGQAKAQDKLTKASKDYKGQLDKLPGAFSNVMNSNKILGKSFRGVRGSFGSMIDSIVAGANSVLTEFGAKKIKFSIQNGKKTVTGWDDEGNASTVVGQATGGWVGKAGQKGRDTVRTVLGKGEAVLNSAQQKIVNSALYNSGIGGLNDVFSRTKGSYHYMATGGYAGLQPGISKATSAVLKKFPGLSVTSTTGGTHAAGSYHYKGQAVDIGGDSATMNRAAAWIKGAMGKRLTEGIHNPNLSIKGGQNVPSSFWGASTWANHANHIHLAVAGALGKISGAVGAMANSIKAPKIGGANGMMKTVLKTAASKITRAANSYLNKKLGSMGGGDSSDISLMPKGGGETVGASMFGGPGDPGTGHIGYRGDDLNQFPNSFAELSNSPGGLDFSALGGLPYKAKLKISGPRGSAIAYKRDVGAGGGAVQGHKRAIDLWYTLAEKLGINGLGLVKIKRMAEGGFAGKFHDGGMIPGTGEKAIIAKGGEAVLTAGQFTNLLKAITSMASSISKIKPNYGTSDADFRDDYNTIKNGYKGNKKITSRMDKALAAIRDLTADNGVIAQFATVLENFSTKLTNSLKKGSYQFNKAGKGTKLMSDVDIAKANVDNIEAEGRVQQQQISKIKSARNKAKHVRSRAERERNEEDVDNLGDIYDAIDRRQAEGKDTTKLERIAKRREAKLKKTKKGKAKLKRLKSKNARLKRARKGVQSINDALDTMEANQADLAQQAYEAQYDYIQAQNSNSQDAFDIANTNSDITMASSVAAGANASIKNAALSQRNNDIEGVIQQLTALGGKDSEIAKLRQEQAQNTQEMKRNTIATIVNTSQIKQNLVAFKSGVIGTGVNILKSLGALSGTTNNSLISSLLGNNASNLAGNRSSIIGSLNQFLGTKGMAGIGTNLSGESLVSTLVGLSSTNTLGWTQEEQDAFQNLIQALLDNESAIVDNSQQLKDLNGNITQDFTSSSWSMFRQAVFNGSNGLMPQYAGTIPQMAVGGLINREGFAYLHPAEVVLNKHQAAAYSSGRGDTNVYITSPTEVLDPEYISGKLAFELNNRGK